MPKGPGDKDPNRIKEKGVNQPKNQEKGSTQNNHGVVKVTSKTAHAAWASANVLRSPFAFVWAKYILTNASHPRSIFFELSQLCEIALT